MGDDGNPLAVIEAKKTAVDPELGDYQSTLDSLRANGGEIFFEEDRRGGTIDGPRAYFRDPDGTALEFINRTAYACGN